MDILQEPLGCQSNWIFDAPAGGGIGVQQPGNESWPSVSMLAPVAFWRF